MSIVADPEKSDVVACGEGKGVDASLLREDVAAMVEGKVLGANLLCAVVDCNLTIGLIVDPANSSSHALFFWCIGFEICGIEGAIRVVRIGGKRVGVGSPLEALVVT